MLGRAVLQVLVLAILSPIYLLTYYYITQSHTIKVLPCCTLHAMMNGNLLFGGHENQVSGTCWPPGSGKCSYEIKLSHTLAPCHLPQDQSITG